MSVPGSGRYVGPGASMTGRRAAVPPDAIRIEGLAEFRRSLKAMSGESAKALRAAGNKAANIIVDDARPKVPTGPGRGGHAVSSIKASSTQTAARIKEGGNKYPYMPWLDFGGKVGRRKSVKRPFIKTGRYIWASFDERSAEVTDVLVDGLMELVRANGLEVTE